MLLSNLLQSTNDAIISTDTSGNITSWNPGAEKMFGYKAIEVLGKNTSCIIPPENQKEESDIVRDIIATLKTSKEYETVRTRSNGSCFQVSITITLFKDINDQVIGTSHIIRDIDVLKGAQEKQSLLAAIIDSSDDAIISKNLNGIITSWNAGAERIFGFMAH